MTVQEIVLDLLSYANIYGFELGGTDDGEDEGEVVKGVAAVNQSLQLIYRDGPESLKFASRSSFINLPTTITLNLTQGSNIATMSSNFAPWMRGCSVMIDGDAILNRIKDIVWNNVLSTFTLLRAYTGATGAHTGTVYADSLLLDADVAAVLEPVTLAPNTRLRPAQTKSDFMGTYFWIAAVTGRRIDYWPWFTPWYTTWEKRVGTPQEYRVEQMQDTARTGGGSLYLGLNPMPTQLTNITYDVYRKPVPIDRTTMLNEEGGNDPAIEIPCLPPDMVESFLLPIARWRYVAAHPNVQNREVRASLKSEYDEAVMRLRSGSSLTPQVNIARARYL